MKAVSVWSLLGRALGFTKPRASVSLDAQLEAFGRLGITMRDDVTVGDLLAEHDRAEYECHPYELLLFTLGGEAGDHPPYRPFSDAAWHHDTECVDGPGAYVDIVENLCRLAGVSDLLSDLSDSIHPDSNQGWVAYRIGNDSYRFDVRIDDDWVDSRAWSAVTATIERDGSRFYGLSGGQDAV